MNKLFIDTTESGKVKVVLLISVREVGGQRSEKNSNQKFGSQVLLNLIEEILADAKLDRKDLEGIEVKTGPGSYTGIKVGVAVANALAFGLGIPVNGKETETELIYE